MRISVGRAIGLVVALALATGLVWFVWPDSVLVETATVTQGTFEATVDEDGKTRIRERYVVAVPLAGRLKRVSLKAGDHLNADDVIATILPSPTPLLDPRSRREAEERLGSAEAAQERAQTLVERARAQSSQADQDLTRTRTLVERGASTKQALERDELAKRVADRDLRAAEFQFHAGQHELEQARALLAKYTDSGGAPPDSWNVSAPISGVVLKVDQESETIVRPGIPILEIGDPRDMEVVVDVLRTDAVEIHPGADATIEHWGGPGILAGRVRRVEPAAFTKISTLGVEEQRVNVLIDILSAPEQRSGLGDAYQVDAKIVVFKRDDAVIAPAGALFRRGNSWNVFVAENGRAQVRPVTLLRRSGQSAALSAGVEPGENVIVYPSDRVTSGVRVTAVAR
jgi:HlyD family secretion protein